VELFEGVVAIGLLVGCVVRIVGSTALRGALVPRWMSEWRWLGVLPRSACHELELRHALAQPEAQVTTAPPHAGTQPPQVAAPPHPT
jgi:hypothetical protein